MVERNGMRLPEKDDQFTHDQSRVQNRDGWLLHPLDESRAAPAGRRQASVAPGYPTNVQRSKPEPAEPTGRNLFGLGSTGRPGVTWAMAETPQALWRGRRSMSSAPCPGSGGLVALQKVSASPAHGQRAHWG